MQRRAQISAWPDLHGRDAVRAQNAPVPALDNLARPDLQTRAAARLLEPQEHSMSGEQLFEQQDKCSRNKQAKLKRHTRMSSRKNTRRSRGHGNCEEQTNTTNRDARPLLALNVRGLPRS